MSTAPTGWQNPKQNWTSDNVPLPTDFNRIEENINAIEQGNRTVDPAQAPTSNIGSLRQFFDWLTNRIKAIMGTTNWYDAPPTTLFAANTHMNSIDNPHVVTANLIGAAPADPYGIFMLPTDTVVIADTTQVVCRQDINSTTFGKVEFSVNKRGKYRLSCQVWASTYGICTLSMSACDSFVTTSTSAVSVTRDMNYPADVGGLVSFTITPKIDGEYSFGDAYMKNCTIKGSPGTPPANARVRVVSGT